MKIFDFFYSEKVIFHKNKKNTIIAQQKEELVIYTTRDDNERVWDVTVSSRPDSFIFFNSQTYLILKIKKGWTEMGKFPNSSRLHFIFVFIFKFLFFFICFLGKFPNSSRLHFIFVFIFKFLFFFICFLGKFPNSPRLHFIFVFIFKFLFFYLLFYFYYIKINIFHKNKNIMNFYNYLLKNIIIIIIIYIKV